MFIHSPACIFELFQVQDVLILHELEEHASEVFKHPSCPKRWRVFLWLQRCDAFPACLMDLSVYSREIWCKGLRCVMEMRLRGEMHVWRHIIIRHFRHHTPPHRSLISPSSFNKSLCLSLSFVSLNSDVFACPVQLCDWKLLLWFSERVSAVLRLIVIPADACAFEELWLQSCVFDAHALLWSALDYTYKTVCCSILNHVLSGKITALLLLLSWFTTQEKLIQKYWCKYNTLFISMCIRPTGLSNWMTIILYIMKCFY